MLLLFCCNYLKAGYTSEIRSKALTHRVEYRRPPFHGDTLEHREHGQADVVEGGDAQVGPLPLLKADGHVGIAGVGAGGGQGRRTRVARGAALALSDDLL